jgi:hypothetical protein
LLTVRFVTFCVQPLRDLMQRCWNQDPRQRPSFTAILNQIKSIKL